MSRFRRFRSRVPLLFALAALAGVWFLAAAESGPPAGDAPAVAVRRVAVATVEAAAAARTVRFSGMVRAAHRARLAFTVDGRVAERPVEVGDRVAEGALLARLDERRLANAVAAAEASVAELRARRAQLERDRRRVVSLQQAKAATDEEMEQVAAALDAVRAGEAAANARLHEARREHGEARLTAPFAGTVTEVLVEPGEHVNRGQPAVALSGDGALEVELEVPESLILRLRPGDPVAVDLPALGGAATAAGRVTSVGRAATGRGRLFPVIATLDDDDRADGMTAAAGMTAEVAVTITDPQALSVPVEAVVNPGGRRPAVFRLRADGAAVQKVEVTVGALAGGRVVVQGALEAGDRVVVGGQRGLLDGDPVEVVP